MSGLRERIKMDNLINRLPNLPGQTGDEISKRATYLQLVLICLMVFRVAFAIWALVDLAFFGFLWNALVLAICFFGSAAVKRRNQLFLLGFVVLMGAVVILSLIDFFIGIATNLFKLSVVMQLLYLILTAIHLILEASSVLLAWGLYRLLTGPQSQVTFSEDGRRGDYLPTVSEEGIELQEGVFPPQPNTQAQYYPGPEAPIGQPQVQVQTTPYGMAAYATPPAQPYGYDAHQMPPAQGGQHAAVSLYPITYDNPTGAVATGQSPKNV
jgi:hypothetical protein